MGNSGSPLEVNSSSPMINNNIDTIDNIEIDEVKYASSFSRRETSPQLEFIKLC